MPKRQEPDPQQVPNPQEPPISDPPPSETGDMHDPVEPQPVDETDISTPSVEGTTLDGGEDIDEGQPIDEGEAITVGGSSSATHRQ